MVGQKFTPQTGTGRPKFKMDFYMAEMLNLLEETSLNVNSQIKSHSGSLLLKYRLFYMAVCCAVNQLRVYARNGRTNTQSRSCDPIPPAKRAPKHRGLH